MNIHCLLFDDYEALDLMGPVELLHHVPGAVLHYHSQHGGRVRSTQGFSIDTQALSDLPAGSVLLLPGGMGTRQKVHDADFLHHLAAWVAQAEACLSVCTGSALLAATGCLDGRAATSNKRAFEWVKSVNPKVHWQAIARWVQDGKFYTSSGISAGMDMTLGFIAQKKGLPLAEEIAAYTEYLWQQDPGLDPFAALYGYKRESP